MRGFFAAVESLLADCQFSSVLEVGCGEGEIGSRLVARYPNVKYRGLDIAEDVILEARRRYPDLSFEVLSIYDLPSKAVTSDLIVASEVFEHLEDPALGMRAILQAQFRYLIVSVPREPIWRVLNVLRGKYLDQLGNTPGHVNHWSKSSFVAFVGQFSKELELVRIKSPFPWTMLLLRRRDVASY
jgi:ubiquinone/menaquinone biosynthesis C-methylase UbiE